MIKIKHILLGVVGCSLAMTSCDLDEVFYSKITTDNFFTAPENTYAVLGRPYTHLKYFFSGERWYLQELVSDEMTCPFRTKGKDFYNNGEYVRLQEHTWTSADRFMSSAYIASVQGVARTIASREDLANVDYVALGLTEADKEWQLNQLDCLTAYYYMRCLDFFGGVPLVYSTNDDVKPRATDKEIFDHVESLIKSSRPHLKVRKSVNESQDGFITQAAATVMLGMLYLNAEAYIGEDHFADAQKEFQDVIDGVYGPYALDSTWYGPHCFDNDSSSEAIWNVMSEHSYMEWNWWYRYFLPQNAKAYFNLSFPQSMVNGFILTPSRATANGPIYTAWKLGNSYEKFNDSDLRKQPYVYMGNKKYKGMFLVGELTNPYTGESVLGTKEYTGQVITRVDCVDVPGGTKSHEMEGEENSGIVLIKSPLPNDDDYEYLWNPDMPIYRLSEVYYALAECKWRAGEKKEAAALINQVRKRNFENGVDPDPVPDDFDIYRMADEWLVEFLGEGHRRTDLIRWGLWTTEDWWAHDATNDKNKCRYPIPDTYLAGNALLEQNPGY
jgi:hypothetical protein